MKEPKEITLCNLEVIVMPNGEIICLGKSIGFVKEFGKYLIKKEIKMRKVKVEVKIIDFTYVDDDILCIEVKDDRGVIYRGSLEKKE